ncbi:MAG: hypothetical protein JNG83_04720 [Opitutaceae bacterium]|nr:hypothetical protein [Opitutaceae bacterium]
MPSPHRPNQPAGFALVEVMMAATILVVGFIGMIQALTIGSEMLDASHKQLVAQQLVDYEVEQLRTSPWDTIAGLNSSGSITINSTGTAISGNTTRFALTNFTSSTSDDNTTLRAAAPGFTIAYSRTYLRPDFASSSTVTYLQIDYTVSWTSNTGRAYSRTAVAYFAKNGLRLSYQKT